MYDYSVFKSISKYIDNALFFIFLRYLCWFLYLYHSLSLEKVGGLGFLRSAQGSLEELLSSRDWQNFRWTFLKSIFSLGHEILQTHSIRKTSLFCLNINFCNLCLLYLWTMKIDLVISFWKYIYFVSLKFLLVQNLGKNILSQCI